MAIRNTVNTVHLDELEARLNGRLAELGEEIKSVKKQLNELKKELEGLGAAATATETKSTTSTKKKDESPDKK